MIQLGTSAKLKPINAPFFYNAFISSILAKGKLLIIDDLKKEQRINRNYNSSNVSIRNSNIRN